MTIQVAVLFPNPEKLLRPGQYARIRAVIKTIPNALLVPQQAVTQLQTKYQIAVVNADNTVDIRIVNPGERIGSLWVINEGLQPGDRVIVEGLQKVRNGMKVDPKPFVEPLETAPGSSSTSATK